MVSLVPVEHICLTSLESFKMSVFHVLLASTVNFLDKQMPQDLAVQGICVEVVPDLLHQMIQVMLIMVLVPLDIIVKKELQTAQCVRKAHSDPTLELNLVMIVCLALEVNTALNQDFLSLLVTVVQDTIAQLKKTFVLHSPAASNAQEDISVQMVLQIHMDAIQGHIKNEYMKHHVMSAQRLITVQPTRLIHCHALHIITAPMEHIHQSSVPMEHLQIPMPPS